MARSSLFRTLLAATLVCAAAPTTTAAEAFQFSISVGKTHHPKVKINRHTPKVVVKSHRKPKQHHAAPKTRSHAKRHVRSPYRFKSPHRVRSRLHRHRSHFGKFKRFKH